MSTVADGIGHRTACRSGALASCQIKFSNTACLIKASGERGSIRRLCLEFILFLFPGSSSPRDLFHSVGGCSSQEPISLMLGRGPRKNCKNDLDDQT